MAITSRLASDSIKSIRSALDELLTSALPTPVGGWLVETGIDFTEEDAVWVWAILEEDEDKIEFAQIEELDAIVTKQVQKITGPDVTTYVRFRGVGEKLY